MTEVVSLKSQTNDLQQNTQLATKLYIPYSSNALLKRPRLDSMLDNILSKKLTIISAGAGFGKTTLICEWLEKQQSINLPVGWVSLDDADNDQNRFWSYFLAAADGIKPNAAKRALALLAGNYTPSFDYILAELINGLSAADHDFIMVLDDYHLINNTSIDNSLNYLLERMPAKMHIVITSRTEPALSLAKLRVRGQLLEIRANDLRFSREESIAFFKEILQVQLNDEVLGAIDSRTEGWIAGLQLAALTLKETNDHTNFLQDFTGDHRYIFDYLAEEVLDLLNDEMQRFLLQTSVLTRLNADLCNFVVGITNSQKMIEQLDRANMFIIPLDGKRSWYRYHHLFADFLQKRLHQLDPQSLKELHSKAARWYAKNTDVYSAINHGLLAHDFEFAVEVLEGAASKMVKDGELLTLLRWFNALPKKLIYQNATLSICNAWALALTGNTDGAVEIVEHINQKLLSIDDNIPGKEHRDETLGQTYTIMATAASMRDDIQESIDYCGRALELLPENDSARGVVILILGMSQIYKGDLKLASQTLNHAIRINEGHNNYSASFNALVGLCRVYEWQGELKKAAQILKTILKDIQEGKGRGLRFSGMIYTGFASILYQWNDLSLAEQYVNKGIEIGQRDEDYETLIMAGVVSAKLHWAKGNIDEALDCLDNAEQILHKSKIKYLKKRVSCWKSLYLLWQNRLGEVEQWLKQNSINSEWDNTFDNEFEHIVFSRYLVASGYYKKALSVQDKLLAAANTGAHLDNALQVQIGKILALKGLKRFDEAVNLLGSVLSFGEANGYIRVFLDEKEQLAELVEKIILQKKSGKITEANFTLKYAQKLLQLMDFDYKKNAISHPNLQIGKTGVFIEPLSDRELEVLGLVALGMSNKEISERIFVTVGTVKLHLNNIYSKLSVHSRTQAIALARELGII